MRLCSTYELRPTVYPNSAQVEKEVLGYHRKFSNNASIVVIVVKILTMLQQLLLFTGFFFAGASHGKLWVGLDFLSYSL